MDSFVDEERQTASSYEPTGAIIERITSAVDQDFTVGNRLAAGHLLEVNKHLAHERSVSSGVWFTFGQEAPCEGALQL